MIQISKRINSIELAREYVKNNSECELLSDIYIDSNSKLNFKCKCGNEFERTMHQFRINKYKCCQSCANKKANNNNRLKIDELKEETKLLSNCILLSDTYENNSQKLQFKCSCDEIFETSWSEFKGLNKRQCNKCSSLKRMNYEEVKNFIETESNCKLISKEYVNSHNKLTIQCECGELFEQSFRDFRDCYRRTCKKCSGVKSNYEIYVQDILNKNKINYKEQYTYNDCKNVNKLPFDFYLIDYNILIEVDGEQHFRPYRFENDIINFADRIYNDAIKNAYCEDNNIILIRIPYFNIKNSEDMIIKEINKYANTEVS